MKLPEHSELIVVGGGPGGRHPGLLAARAGRQSPCWKRAPTTPAAATTSRAGAVARQPAALLAAGGWPDSLAATAIDTVHISQQGSFGRTLIQRDDLAAASGLHRVFTRI